MYCRATCSTIGPSLVRDCQVLNCCAKTITAISFYNLSQVSPRFPEVKSLSHSHRCSLLLGFPVSESTLCPSLRWARKLRTAPVVCSRLLCTLFAELRVCGRWLLGDTVLQLKLLGLLPWLWRPQKNYSNEVCSPGLSIMLFHKHGATFRAFTSINVFS